MLNYNTLKKNLINANKISLQLYKYIALYICYASEEYSSDRF